MSETGVERATASAALLPAELGLGAATLAMAEAGRSLAFYRDVLGLELLEETGERLTLGAGERPLLHLLVRPGLRPRPRATTGLYHVAILLPDRLGLARVLERLLTAGVPLGSSDHLVSEALYLDDPDGNGLELYRDRPRDQWRWRGDRVEMGLLPFDFEGVLGELRAAPAAAPTMPPGTRVGHIHLQVADLEAAAAFYHDIVGFEEMARMTGARFLSAGRYHHHLGMNTWHSAGAPPTPATAAGLRAYIVELPAAGDLAALRARLEAAGLAVREQPDGLSVVDPAGVELVVTAPAA